MKYLQYVVIAAIIMSLISCSKSSDSPDDVHLDTSYEISNDLSYNAIISQFGSERLAQGVEQPDSGGALGRNKDGYFHVRFQLNMTSISDFVIATERIDALQHLSNTISYSFERQMNDGSFEFSPPEELVNSPDYTPPSTGDLESGTAFFASSLGLSLLSLQNSNWFLSSEETQAIKQEIETFKPAIEKTLNYLIVNKEILAGYDAKAPNRLLFDALAFYSLGKYLEREDAQNIAFEFIESSLILTDSAEGYFIEGGGWDSSYNGVAIKLAMEIFCLINQSDQKSRLGAAIVAATAWQISRINESGEVSSEGNTRVFEGGETFLGEEKGIDYAKTVKALYYFGNLAGSSEIIELGDTVLEFYQ